MRHHFAKRLIALIVSMTLMPSFACTARKVHPLHTPLPQEKVRDIKVGDTVKIATYSGEHYRFVVDDLTPATIEGEGHVVALVEIEHIEKVRFTGRRIAAAVGIVALLVMLVWLGSNSQSQRDARYDTGGSAK